MSRHLMLRAVIAAVIAAVAGCALAAAFIVPNTSKNSKLVGLVERKIIGGSKISIMLRPYMASIQFLNRNSPRLDCGSSVIDKWHLLTAAHCIKYRNVKRYLIRVGSNTWTKGGMTFSVDKIFVHPKYNQKTLQYDVAVIRLSKSLPLGATIDSIELAKSGAAINEDTTVRVTGWGYSEPVHSSTFPSALSEVTLETISQTDCQDMYSSQDLVVTNDMFCANYPRRDSCQGDSGGPIVDHKTGQQIGIVSWGMGCAQMGFAGVFTRIAHPEISQFISNAVSEKIKPTASRS